MSFESRTDYGGRIDFGAFRFVLYDRNTETKNACLSEAPCVSRAVLGKSNKVKLMQVPWPQGRAQSGQNRSRIYFEGIKGSNGSVWCSCSCRSTWVFAYFLDYLLFEIIETHKQLAQIADIMNNLVYDFFKRSVVAVERRTAKGSRVIGRGYREETRMRDHAMKMMQYCWLGIFNINILVFDIKMRKNSYPQFLS